MLGFGVFHLVFFRHPAAMLREDSALIRPPAPQDTQ